jgi:hypothetical protein
MAWKGACHAEGEVQFSAEQIVTLLRQIEESMAEIIDG